MRGHFHAGIFLVLASTAAGCAPSPIEGELQSEPRCEAPEWAPLLQGLDRAVLGIGGTAANDVYLVGGDLGVGGTGSLIAHFDGVRWAEIATGRSETLWWVWARTKDDVWFVGDRGLI